MLFSGKAYFSASVPAWIQVAWVANGGTKAETDQDIREAQYFFCEGRDDPCLPDWIALSLIVRQLQFSSAADISDVADEFDPQEIGLSDTRLDDSSSDDDEEKLRHYKRPYCKKADSEPDRQVFRSNRRSACGYKSVGHVQKRIRFEAYHSDEETTSQVTLNPSDANGIDAPSQVSILETDPETTMQGTPDHSLLQIPKALKNDYGLAVIDLRVLTKHKPKKDEIKCFKSRIQSLYPRMAGNDTTIACNPAGTGDLPEASYLFGVRRSSRAAFWRQVLDSYSGTGPLQLSIDDLTKHRPPTIKSSLFVVGKTYMGKVFQCHLS